MTTRVLIVEDHPLLGEAMDALLRREPEFDVIGVSATLADARRALAETSPALVVLDQHLPDGKGTDLARAIRDAGRGTTVVMFTGDASDDTLLAAVEAGVAGFLSKADNSHTIVSLLRRAAAGEIVIPAHDLGRLLLRQRDRELTRRERARVGADLTPRDRDILQLMAEGCDTKEMASRTGLAVNTIRGHVQTVIEKLQVHSRLEAVLRATSLELIRPGERPLQA